jgi:hypothetical protein
VHVADSVGDQAADEVGDAVADEPGSLTTHMLG